MRDISDDGSGTIRACLCDSDLCNNKVILNTNNDGTETERKFQSVRPTTTTTSTTTMRGITTLPILAEIVQKSEIINDVGIEETPRRGAGFKVNLGNSLFLDSDKNSNDNKSLRCYSCGSLLSPDKNCTQFNSSDPAQVQTCSADEACLMYTWFKSSTEKGTYQVSQKKCPPSQPIPTE